MSVPTYPGVYVQEVPSGVHPIAAVSTSIPAFIGMAEKGTLDEAVKVFSFTEYQNLYGGFLNYSYLSHAVFQFFNNGGSQCYIIRVGQDTAIADIALNDRAAPDTVSLTIAANSPGAWGNSLAVVISDGTSDPGNEFNLSVFQEGELTPLETFESLSMAESAANFVESVTLSSQYIRVEVNAANGNVDFGTSVGLAASATTLVGFTNTRLNININGDGYQEVDLQDAADDSTVTDLASIANIRDAITRVVSNLIGRPSTDPIAFSGFQCDEDPPASGILRLRSGVASFSSSVTIAPTSNRDLDASGLLRLGRHNGGTETVGGAVTRPLNNPTPPNPPDNYYLLGDNAPTTEVISVEAGSDGTLINNDSPYIAAFSVLDDIDDVSLIAVPGIGSSGLVGEGVNYCANRSLSDCFFIGDMSQDDDLIGEAETFRNAITPKNSYGAIYLPWVQMLDPTGQSPEPILVPPSGYVAGLYAKTDAQRGVWTAPAGTSVALGGALGLAVNFTDVQQGNLNPINVNLIRQFASSGIVLWGARTISSPGDDWTYIPVRRMGIFLRVSIYRGIQWAVFEPNDTELWSQLRLSITAFMTTLFRQGAFQGSTPSDAFFVKCDSETTTQADIDLGIVNVLVGFAPIKPAEFVVVKISQKAGQSA